MSCFRKYNAAEDWPQMRERQARHDDRWVYTDGFRVNLAMASGMAVIPVLAEFFRLWAIERSLLGWPVVLGVCFVEYALMLPAGYWVQVVKDSRVTVWKKLILFLVIGGLCAIGLVSMEIGVEQALTSGAKGGVLPGLMGLVAGAIMRREQTKGM